MTQFPLLPPDLKERVVQVIQAYPSSLQVFESVIDFFSNDSAQKKRKLEPEPELGELKLSLSDLSFLHPRKKLDLQVYSSVIQLVKDQNVVESIFYLQDLLHAVCVPTPDKQKPHSTFVLLFKNGGCISFSMEDESVVQATIKDEKTTLKKDQVLVHLEKTLQKFKVPCKSAFSSVNSTSKKPIFHVICHLKVKESFLYFMPQGLFLGFKKPLYFFELSKIKNLTISGITSRTFNLTIQVEVDDKIVDFELTTIESLEYDPIFKYITNYKKDWNLDQTTGQMGVASATTATTTDVVVDEESDADDKDFEGSSESSVSEEYDSQDQDLGSDLSEDEDDSLESSSERDELEDD